MSTEDIHIEQANRNHQILDRLIADQSPFYDWIVIVAFYKAVHVVEAVFVLDQPHASQHSTGHKERNRVLKRDYPVIWQSYYQLFRASLVARYLEYQHNNGGHQFATFITFMTPQQVLIDLLGTDLTLVETEAVPYLSGMPALKLYAPPAGLAGPAPGASQRFAQPPTSSPAKP